MESRVANGSSKRAEETSGGSAPPLNACKCWRALRLVALVALLSAASATASQARPAPPALVSLGEQIGERPSNQTTFQEPDPEGRLAEWKAFKSGPLYLEPFEPDVLYLPREQLDWARGTIERDFELYREIVDTAVEEHRSFMASSRLMVRFVGKVLRNFIKNRRQESSLKSRVELSRAFFTMLADILDQVVELSGQRLEERAYSKSNFNKDHFRNRTFSALEYIKRIVDTSPLGAYHRWNNFTLFNDHPDPNSRRQFPDEAVDLYAQFRGAGYETTKFAAKRISRLLRLFGSNKIPESEERV